MNTITLVKVNNQTSGRVLEIKPLLIDILSYIITSFVVSDNPQQRLELLVERDLTKL